MTDNETGSSNPSVAASREPPSCPLQDFEFRAFTVKRGLNQHGPDAVMSFFKGMTQSTREPFLKDQNKLFSYTVGVNDMLVVLVCFRFRREGAARCRLLWRPLDLFSYAAMNSQ